MNREIRFRAWDKRRNIMIGDDYPKNWGDNKDEWYFDLACMQLTGIEEISNDEDHIVMQYTGLKDKNGVEIYEGDIVKTKNSLYKVIYDKCCFWGIDEMGKYPIYQIKHYVIEDEIFEVIGNIYENPELLN